MASEAFMSYYIVIKLNYMHISIHFHLEYVNSEIN